MADTLRFNLVSPERQLMSEDVASVIVPGENGQFGVFPNHAPLMATVAPGLLSVNTGADGPKRIFVRGGFAEVTPEGLTVLAEEATPAEELTGEALSERLKEAEDALAAVGPSDNDARYLAQCAVDSLKQLAG